SRPKLSVQRRVGFRPRLELLETRLPPGDMLLGLVLAPTGFGGAGANLGTADGTKGTAGVAVRIVSERNGSLPTLTVPGADSTFADTRESATLLAGHVAGFGRSGLEDATRRTIGSSTQTTDPSMGRILFTADGSPSAGSVETVPGVMTRT